MKKPSLPVLPYLLCLLVLMSSHAHAQTADHTQLFEIQSDLPPLTVMAMPPAVNTAPIDLTLRADDPAAQSKTDRMDSQLAALVAAASRGGPTQASLQLPPALRVEHGKVHVQIAVDPEDTERVTAVVEAAGGTITGQSLDQVWLQGWAPIQKLAELAEYPLIHYVRHPERLSTLERPDGEVNSEALKAFNVPDWHESGRTGQGIRIAVIDGGFQGYRELLGSELPSHVTITNFVDGGGFDEIEGWSHHGTAIAEIIHDIAPDAELHLVRIDTNIDLKEAVLWLLYDEVDIISTSLGWYNLTPGDGSGEFADLVAMAHEAGILWVTAAGNDRENHWGGPFDDGDADNLLNFSVTQEINYFGPSPNESYVIPAGYAVSIYLRWNDWEDVDQDYDLYLMRWDGRQWKAVESSRNQQNGRPEQTPTETIHFVTHEDPAPYGILVERFRTDQDAASNLDIFIPKFYKPTQIIHARSLTNLADAPLALTVAAVDAAAPYRVEDYSSEGPTNGPGGSVTGGLAKPDLAAYTNVTISSLPDKFGGTSAATPHVVGAAALVMHAYPGWTLAQVRDYLLAHAVDNGKKGGDPRTGNGRLQLGPAPTRMAASTLHMLAVPHLKTGDPITFTLTLVNSSPFDTEISLENAIPGGFDILGDPVTSAGPQPVLAARQLTWQGMILGNQTVEISYAMQSPVVHASQPLRIVNLATITEANGAKTQLQLLFNPHQLFLPVLRGMGE